MYKIGYTLNVGKPVWENGERCYVDKDTGKTYSGWFHCGCCGVDGFMSTRFPICTGCANKVLHGLNDSSKTVVEIREYLTFFGYDIEKTKREFSIK